MTLIELITHLKEMQMLHGGNIEVMYRTIHDDITDIKGVEASDAPVVLICEKAPPVKKPSAPDPFDASFLGAPS